MPSCQRTATTTPTTQPGVDIDHFGGGRLHLATHADAHAFACGRIDITGDIIEMCAQTIQESHPGTHNALLHAFHMLVEARTALLGLCAMHQSDTDLQR